MKREFYKQIFEKYSNVKFCENHSIGSPVVPYGRAGGRPPWQAEATSNSHFSKFCERA